MDCKILVLFLCASVVGMCQSVAPASKTLARVNSQQGTQQWTDCKKIAPDASVSSLAPRQGERRFHVQTQHWNVAQVDSKSTFISPFPSGQPCPFDQQLWRSFQTKLEPLPGQGPHTKSEPIPTEWPNGKFEPIPSDWPGLKVIPMASEPGASATIPAK
jgi:hypothetical protein